MRRRADDREATARLRELVANAQRIEVVDSGQTSTTAALFNSPIDGWDVGQTLMAEGLAVEWRPAWRNAVATGADTDRFSA